MLRFSPAKARAATATTGNGSKDTMHRQAGDIEEDEAARHVELQIATNRVQTALKLSPQLHVANNQRQKSQHRCTCQVEVNTNAFQLCLLPSHLHQLALLPLMGLALAKNACQGSGGGTADILAQEFVLKCLWKTSPEIFGSGQKLFGRAASISCRSFHEKPQ